MNYTYIPKNVDPTAIASSTAGVKPDQVAFLIGYFLESANKRRDELQFKGSITISSQIMVKHFRNYSKGLQALVDAGVLSTTGGYYQGQKSRSYSLTPEYFTTVTEYTYQDKSFQYLMSKKRKKYEREKQKNFKTHHKNLKRWFDPQYLAFDKEYALELAKDLARHDAKLLPIYQMSVHRFADIDNGSFSIDSTAGRLHSPLTNLKSEFRSSIRFINPNNQRYERLYSIDIINCQPYLSQLLLNPSFYNQITSIPSLDSIVPNHIKGIMYAESEQTLTQQGFQPFISDVSSGMFYEKFAALVHNKHQHLDFDRKQAKVAIYQTFFSDNRFIGSSPIAKYDATPKTCFRAQYPEVYEVFAQIKKKNASALAIALQRIESHIMIDTVVKRIYEERPNCPLYTIHDSISTTMEHVEYVMEIIIDEFSKVIGVAPKLDVKGW